MKMEFIDLTDNGKYPNASPRQLIRLFGFTDEEKLALTKAILESVLIADKPLMLHQLDFIQPVNCSVTLKLSSEDEGWVRGDAENEYTCLLSRPSYNTMIEIINHIGDGYNWLPYGDYYDEPAFLLSKYGPW